MMDKLDDMIRLTEKVERATAHLPHGRALGCTELQSAWCPVHGDCRCDGGGLYIEWNPFCPLHVEDIWIHPDSPRLLTTLCEWPLCGEGAVLMTKVLVDGADLVAVCQSHYDVLLAFHGQEGLSSVTVDLV